jgi:hypothetical protein
LLTPPPSSVTYYSNDPEDLTFDPTCAIPVQKVFSQNLFGFAIAF